MIISSNPHPYSYYNIIIPYLLIKNVKIENFEVTEGYGQFDVPGYDSKKSVIKGKIKNYGNKSLSEVEIAVYFLDSTDRRVGEKKYWPVNVNSFMGDSTPLKPNYVRDFGYVVDKDAPSDWAKKAEVEITNIEFSI